MRWPHHSCVGAPDHLERGYAHGTFPCTAVFLQVTPPPISAVINAHRYFFNGLIFYATKRDFKEFYETDPNKAVGIFKYDWYGLDQLYVRDQPQSLFWRIIMQNPDPPSYLPFIRNEALHHQYAHIRKYYSQQEDQWFLSIPYRYLNEKTMTRLVDDSIEAVLLVCEKLRRMKVLDGLKSSLYLLPEALITPYEAPLGN